MKGYRDVVLNANGGDAEAADAAYRRAAAIILANLKNPWKRERMPPERVNDYLDSEYGARIAQEEARGTPIHKQIQDRRARFERHYMEICRRGVSQC